MDIRQVWETARIQHITILLLASASRFDSERLRAIAKDALLGWIEKNSFLKGPHYQSAMECGLRIPVFFYGLKILDDLSENEMCSLLRAVYEHGWWVSRRLSLYTSIGNHTVCECLGLIFAGSVYRGAPEGKAWLGKGVELLGQELRHQVISDGGPAEQSLAYHRFVLDLYWLAADFLEKNGLYDCADWKKRLDRAESFLKAFTDLAGQVPSIGDSDDGYAIAPGIAPARGTAKGAKEPCTSFRESGYTVVRFGCEAVLTFDHGPLGMPPLYNHGHADALSITLSVTGKPVFVDPGTYRYNGAAEFRRYFKGTRAHNTVTLDGANQAVQETGFIWSHPYTSQLKRNEAIADGRLIEACHNGYRRLKDPVEHRRIVAFFGDAHFLILDKFSGNGIHDFELNYHLHPDIAAKKENDWWRLGDGNAVIFIRVLKGLEFTFASGQEEPPFGWFSPAYGIKVKSGVLSCRKRGSPAETTFLTAISLGEALSSEAYLERAGGL
ncbi:MAG: heparinase [Deltaproteobacteria bacterium]|nr:MAG: heparinase [Deltaproteobacteria bacterium]